MIVKHPWLGKEHATSTFQMEKKQYFCPQCGKQEVYLQMDDEQDYYVGYTYYCFACRYSFHLPNTDQPDENTTFVK